MDDAQKQVAQVMDAYTRAVFTRDVDAFMQLYDPAVRVFDAWAVWCYDGAAAWRRPIDGWFGSLGSGRVEVTFEEPQIGAVDSLSMVNAIVTYAGFSADGSPLRSMQNRLTWVLRSDGAGWKIVHEHTSAPIDLEHAKAILSR